MEDRPTLASSNFSIIRQSETLLSIGLLGVLMVILVPLPTFILDILLAMNLATSILLLLITLSVTQPLEISVFPSLLLLMTLCRLSLNVATTRLILLDSDAGKIVSTFGGFVVGGNVLVGLVIFAILVVIQFIVITKGSSRVSEVAARFTLDALPGKQMAIDAELGAGTIDEMDAKRRRDELTREAEFYGAMDGAGKFVRGDAVAGLVITGINLLGGVVLGLTNGLSITEAVNRFSVLTIGDGLVSQIPALIIATTAGILVTKATSKLSLGNEISDQLFGHARPLLLGSLILAALALTPGLPKVPFLALAAVLGIAWRMSVQEAKVDSTENSEGDASSEAKPTDSLERQLEDFVQSDRACLEIGLRLIPLVESKQTKGIADRIKTLRTDLAKRYGFWVPSIRIRDNISLAPDEYRILINGREIARDLLKIDQLLAINPGGNRESLDGESAKDPAFGLPATWITTNYRQRAELHGYTVVEPVTVLITHLGEILRIHAHELLSHEDLKKLLETVKETSPSVVEEIKPDVIRMGDLHQVMVHLLEDRVPINSLPRILETIVKHAPHIKDPALLSEKARAYLGRDIVDRLRGKDRKVPAIVLDPRLEAHFRDATQDGVVRIPHHTLESLLNVLNQEWQRRTLEGVTACLLTDGQIRRPLRNTLKRSLPDLDVIAYHEVPSDVVLEFLRIIKFDDVSADTSASAELQSELTAAA